jgi:hypothetical protein
MGEAWEPSNIAMLFGISEVSGHISAFTLMLQRIRQMRWVQLAQIKASGGRWNLRSLPEWSGNLFSHLQERT